MTIDDNPTTGEAWIAASQPCAICQGEPDALLVHVVEDDGYRVPFSLCANCDPGCDDDRVQLEIVLDQRHERAKLTMAWLSW